jgi:hypothetical protein
MPVRLDATHVAVLPAIIPHVFLVRRLYEAAVYNFDRSD